ncbi:apisimin [Apis cerana cerana]|uniref:Apisimin n=1 Tax=Apis cerana cerana TaxID=94128 RepID=A0A2A3EKN9_APICC|nr:apisimin [Apis cerana cerana]
MSKIIAVVVLAAFCVAMLVSDVSAKTSISAKAESNVDVVSQINSLVSSIVAGANVSAVLLAQTLVNILQILIDANILIQR